MSIVMHDEYSWVLEEINWKRKKVLMDLRDDLHSAYKGSRLGLETIEIMGAAIEGVFPLLWKSGTPMNKQQKGVCARLQTTTRIDEERICDLIEGILKYTPRGFHFSLPKGGDQ